MPERDDSTPQTRGLSGGQLVLMFLAGVAVCALFFSAGFLVGYNERLSKAPPATEQVSAPSEIPPLVTPPTPAPAGPAAAPPATGATEQPASTPAEAPTTEVTHPEPLRPQPLSSAPATPPAEAASKPAAASKPPAAAQPSREEVASKPSAPITRPTEESAVLKSSAPRSAEAATASPEAATGPGGSLVIQVAASTNKHDADKIVSALKALEYSVILVTPEQANEGDNLYRVQVGPFATRESAERIRDKLIQDGFKSPFIKR